MRYLVHLGYGCLILIIIALAHRWGYRQGFAEGVQNVYQGFAEDPASPSGNCFAKGGKC